MPIRQGASPAKNPRTSSRRSRFFEDRATCVIDAVDLENLLGQIEIYGANGPRITSGWGAPSPLYGCAARSGGRPPHQSQTVAFRKTLLNAILFAAHPESIGFSVETKQSENTRAAVCKR